MKAKKKDSPEVTSAGRRKALADDIERFLKAGNEIEQIPDGVSAQDPQGRGKQLRLNTPKTDAAKTDTPAVATVEATETPAEATETPAVATAEATETTEKKTESD